MTRNLTEWPFENGQTEKVGPPNGCRGNAVPSVAESMIQRRTDRHPSHAGRRNGDPVMTKAKARARAKARAAAKAAKPDANGAKPQVNVRSGYFDAKSNTMRNIGSGANIKSVAGHP